MRTRRKMMHGHFCNVKPTSAHNASLMTFLPVPQCLPAYLLCGCVNPLAMDACSARRTDGKSSLFRCSM